MKSVRWLELCKIVNRKDIIAGRGYGGQRMEERGGGHILGMAESGRAFCGRRALKVIRRKSRSACLFPFFYQISGPLSFNFQESFIY